MIGIIGIARRKFKNSDSRYLNWKLEIFEFLGWWNISLDGGGKSDEGVVTVWQVLDWRGSWWEKKGGGEGGRIMGNDEESDWGELGR